MPAVFFAFRDAPERRAALQMPGSLDRYRLFGLDEIAARSTRVRHNLERAEPPPWAAWRGGSSTQESQSAAISRASCPRCDR